MVFPIIPIASVVGMLGGAGTVVWYARLSPEERAEADGWANQRAWELFCRALNNLDRDQLMTVLSYVAGKFC
jgi:hypothetical protein